MLKYRIRIYIMGFSSFTLLFNIMHAISTHPDPAPILREEHWLPSFLTGL